MRNLKEKPDDALFIQKTGDVEMYLYPDLLLVGHLQEKKKGVLNGAFYRVISTTEEACVVKCEITGKELKLDTSFVAQYLRLAFALTQASAQGSTLKGRLAVYTRHPKFTKRHLFVSMSRCTGADLLEVV